MIARAGGFTDYAYLDGASLKRRAKDEDIENQNTGKEQRDAFKDNGDETDNDLIENTLSKSNVKKTDLFFSNYIGINMSKIIKDKNKREDLLLEDGDIINIPRQLQTVKVVGEILNPNSIVYVKGKNFSYYINQAGGFSSNAEKKRSFVQYANGSVSGTRKRVFSKIYPDIEPGSEIVVPAKPQKAGLSPQAVIGIGSSAVSLIAIVFSLLRK